MNEFYNKNILDNELKDVKNMRSLIEILDEAVQIKSQYSYDEIKNKYSYITRSSLGFTTDYGDFKDKDNFPNHSFDEKNVDGVSYKELYVMNHLKKIVIGSPKIPSTYSFRGVDDVLVVVKELLKKGYIYEENMSDRIMKKSVVFLTDILKKYEMKRLYDKQEIVASILELPKDILEKEFPESHYKLSVIGERIVDNNDYFQFFERNSFYFLNEKRYEQFSLFDFMFEEKLKTADYREVFDRISGYNTLCHILHSGVTFPRSYISNFLAYKSDDYQGMILDILISQYCSNNYLHISSSIKQLMEERKYDVDDIKEWADKLVYHYMPKLGYDQEFTCFGFEN